MVSSTASTAQRGSARGEELRSERREQIEMPVCTSSTYHYIHRYNKMKRKRVWRARNSIHLGSLEDPILAMIFVYQ